MPTRARPSAGGQRRSVYLPCGKCIRGHPKRIQTALNLHHKTCKTCGDSDKFVSDSVGFDNDSNRTDFHDSGDYKRRNKDILLNGWKYDGSGETAQEWVSGANTESNEFRNGMWDAMNELDALKMSKDEKKRKRKAEQKARKKVRDKMKVVLEDIVNGKQLSTSTTNPRPEIDLDYDSDDEIKKTYVPQTAKEQYAKSLGDCVKSTFVHLYLDWKDTGVYRLHQYTYVSKNTFEQMFDKVEESFNVHQLTYNPDKDTMYDFSNGRNICRVKDDYDECIYPPPICESKGKTLDTLRDEAKVWAGEMVGCGVWDRRWSDMITYVYMEKNHSNLMDKLGCAGERNEMIMAESLEVIKSYYKYGESMERDKDGVDIIIDEWVSDRQ
tara:strand:+ start:14334 stop:15479 length:1146 start_codon:yes stop_codon:yes gene_type:complete